MWLHNIRKRMTHSYREPYSELKIYVKRQKTNVVSIQIWCGTSKMTTQALRSPRFLIRRILHCLYSFKVNCWNQDVHLFARCDESHVLHAGLQRGYPLCKWGRSLTPNLWEFSDPLPLPPFFIPLFLYQYSLKFRKQ